LTEENYKAFMKSVDDFMYNWFKHPSRFYPTGDFNRVIFYIQNLEKKSIEVINHKSTTTVRTG
jgi:hypothetical protein